MSYGSMSDFHLYWWLWVMKRYPPEAMELYPFQKEVLNQIERNPNQPVRIAISTARGANSDYYTRTALALMPPNEDWTKVVQRASAIAIKRSSRKSRRRARKK